MQTIMFIELGMGADMHGQDVTRAAIRAVQNAIYHNSLPGMRTLLKERGIEQMKVHVRLAAPCDHDQLDVDAVRKVFPYGEITVEVVQGGMITSSGIVLPDRGDKSDQMLIVNAAIEVGY